MHTHTHVRAHTYTHSHIHTRIITHSHTHTYSKYINWAKWSGVSAGALIGAFLLYLFTKQFIKNIIFVCTQPQAALLVFRRKFGGKARAGAGMSDDEATAPEEPMSDYPDSMGGGDSTVNMGGGVELPRRDRVSYA